MNAQGVTAPRMYGHRARIGYVCPPPIAEVVPYEFYKIVPDGVTLVVTTLTVTEPSKTQVSEAYELSMRAARALAIAIVDSCMAPRDVQLASVACSKAARTAGGRSVP